MPVQTCHTPDELQQRLGDSLRQLRLARNLEQRVITLLRVLKALGQEASLDVLVPAPAVSPMAMLRAATPRQRARHGRPR